MVVVENKNLSLQHFKIENGFFSFELTLFLIEKSMLVFELTQLASAAL